MAIGVIKEANYGGAYDIDPEQYFTKEELVDFGEKVCDHLNEIFYDVYDISDLSLDDKVLKLSVVDTDGSEFQSVHKIDMRTIKDPSDLNKYIPSVVDNLCKQIKNYKKEISEMVVRKFRESYPMIKESQGNYEIKKLTMDVAVRKGDQIKGVMSSQGRAPLYYDIAEVLKKHGYEMAGDYIDVEDGDTNVYVDNEYEFFNESRSTVKEALREADSSEWNQKVIDTYIDKFTSVYTPDTHDSIYDKIKERSGEEIADAVLAYLEDDYKSWLDESLSEDFYPNSEGTPDYAKYKYDTRHKVKETASNEEIKQAIIGNKEAIKSLKSKGYYVNPLVNPLAAAEVGTFVVKDPDTFKEYTYDNTLSSYAKSQK